MDQIQVRVMTPLEMLYEGPAYAVSSINSSGKFDILASHANFITIINNQPIIITKLDQTRQEFKFSQAIVFTSKSQVSVFADPQVLEKDFKV